MARLHLSVSDKIHEQLQEFSAKEEVSTSEIMRIALREYLEIERLRSLGHQVRMFDPQTEQYYIPVFV